MKPGMFSGMHKASPLLLDTHIWIWLMDGVADKLPARVRARIQVAADRGLVYVSAMSVWEVAMLEARKQLTLSVELSAWADRALAAPGVQLAPFSSEIAIDSTRLPGRIHGDPADRILIATARHLNAALVTCDRRILDYSQGGYVKTFAAEA